MKYPGQLNISKENDSLRKSAINYKLVEISLNILVSSKKFCYKNYPTLHANDYIMQFKETENFVPFLYWNYFTLGTM